MGGMGGEVPTHSSPQDLGEFFFWEIPEEKWSFFPLTTEILTPSLHENLNREEG